MDSFFGKQIFFNERELKLNAKSSDDNEAYPNPPEPARVPIRLNLINPFFLMIKDDPIKKLELIANPKPI
jgi:hypothetical protein